MHKPCGGCFCKTVRAFVFLPWDLNEFDFKAADSTLHFLQVLLHSLISALVVAIDLACYYLRIAMHNPIFSTYCLREIQPSHQGLVFSLVVGCREI